MADGEKSLLDDWVYAENRLLSTFERQMAEQHATAQLSRSLASGRLIAVLGSGLSLGYGHPNWHSLLTNSVSAIRSYCLGIMKRNEGSQNTNTNAKRARNVASRISQILDVKDDTKKQALIDEIATTYRLTLLVRHLESFLAMGLDDKRKPAGDELTIGFEVCENLFIAIRQWEAELRSPTSDPKIIAAIAAKKIRERIQWQTLDDRGRAGLLLAEIFENLEEKLEKTPDLEYGELSERLTRHNIAVPILNTSSGHGPHNQIDFIRWIHDIVNFSLSEDDLPSRERSQFAGLFGLVLFPVSIR